MNYKEAYEFIDYRPNLIPEHKLNGVGAYGHFGTGLRFLMIDGRSEHFDVDDANFTPVGDDLVITTKNGDLRARRLGEGDLESVREFYGLAPDITTQAQLDEAVSATVGWLF